MRILRVANIIEEGKLGGPQIRIARVACALKDRVHTTVVLPLENSERFRQKLDEYKVPYRAFHLSRLTREFLAAVRFVLFSALEVAWLTMYFIKERFDLVHVSGGAWQYKGAIAGKLAGCKVIWHLNDTSTPFIIRKLFSIVSGLADGYIFASERSWALYNTLVQRGKPEFLVPAPVDTSHFSPEVCYSGDEELIASWQRKRVIGSVGNINPIKGFDVLIRAAAELNKQFHDLQFVVVGTVFKNQEHYYEKLVSLAKRLGVENVYFCGTRDDVRPLLQRFDIYVCSSYAESSPVSVWEAMSMGKAIVATDVGDVPKYVLKGSSGEVVAVDDAVELAGRVAELLSDSARAKWYGKEARRIATENLDIIYCAERHIQAYEMIAR